MPPTDIEWTDRAWPVVNGCEKVSPGCKHCWALALTASRLRNHPRYKGLAVITNNGAKWTGERRLAADILDEPLRTRKPQRWFVANKGDLFGEGVSNETIAAIFGVMAACPHHTFQVLTKRPERMAAWFAWVSQDGTPWERCAYHAATTIKSPVFYGHGHPGWPLQNVHLGVSVEDQERADERLDHLEPLARAGWFTWVSYEPALGPVNFGPWLTFLRWIVVGGESGPGARPFALEWAASLSEQCTKAKVPYFFKQAGGNVLHDGQRQRLISKKGADVEELIVLFDKLSMEDVFRREWPEVRR